MQIKKQTMIELLAWELFYFFVAKKSGDKHFHIENQTNINSE
jgi:hypothetical protein